MNLTVLVLAVLLGGFIAYIADRTGRILGKKRLSLFGLRPRVTAELLTAVAGALIPLVTILIILAVSKDARLYILHYNETIKQRDTLNAEVQQNKVTLKGNQVQLDQQTNALMVLNGKSKTLEAKVNQTSEELNSRTAELNAANERYRLAQDKYIVVDRQYDATKKRVDTLQKSYASIQKTYASVQKAYVAKQQNLKDLQTRYNALKADRDFVAKEVDTDKQAILEDSKTLSNLQTELDSTRADLQTAKNDYAQAQQDLTAAQNSLKGAVATLNVDVPQANQFLLEPVIFNVGEEIARISVPTGLKPTEAGAYVDQLLDKASEIALMHGGAPSNLAQGRAAGFVPVPTQDAAGSQDITLTPQAQYEEVVSELVDSKNPSVLIAKALYNRVKGNFVPLYMERRDNPLVFKQGQPIADTVIRGGNSRGEIFDQVENFLREKVAQKAKASKMVPIEGSDEGLGLVPDADMLDLVEKIHEWGRNAKLTAYAKDNTYAGDRLALGFRLDQ